MKNKISFEELKKFKKIKFFIHFVPRQNCRGIFFFINSFIFEEFRGKMWDLLINNLIKNST